MAPLLQIRLLGTFLLTYENQTLTGLNSPRLQSLLAYLVLHADRPQPRQSLAYLFWPDSTDSQARSNLRKLLYQLRTALPNFDHFVCDEAHTVQWQTTGDYTLDTAELNRLLAQAAQQPLTLAESRRLLELYSGDLLPNCYDDWVLPLRREYQRGVRRALEQLVTHLENTRAYAEGIQYAQILLDFDPLEEISYQRMMRLRMLQGDRAGALRVYQECLAMLKRELGVEPSLLTRQAYTQLVQSPVDDPAAAAPWTLPGTPALVARTQEWEQLLRIWQRVKQGHAHVIVITGEAGIGKTRLAEELLVWGGRQGILAARGRAYATQTALAYAPVIELLRTPALHRRLARLKPAWLVELTPLLPELAELHPNLPAPAPLTERWQRQRLYEALVQALLVDDQPLLLLLDDLQWCDQETLEWLQYLITARRGARLLLVGTLRTGEVDTPHPWQVVGYALRHEAQLTEVELAPLSRAEVDTLATHVAGADLTPQQSAGLYADSGGNPLFVVEMVRALIEQVGATTLPRHSEGEPLALPPRVAVIIEARLAQLSAPARKLMGMAAAIGRSFRFPVLLAASDLAEEAVVDALDELLQRGIVREQAGDAYDFSHDRIRDVAYAQLSQTRRRHHHRRIQAALRRLHAQNLDVVAGQLAAHAEAGGEINDAIDYLARAAALDQRVGAYHEAALRLDRALALLRRHIATPTTPAHLLQELALLMPLGTLRIALRGYGDHEVEAVYKRALEICTQLGSEPQILPILIGLTLFYMIRGELRQALVVAEQFMELAQAAQKDELLVEGHVTLGPVLMYLGRFQEAADHLTQGLARYDPVRDRAHAPIYGQDPGVAGQVCLAITLWLLGYPDRSLAGMHQALIWAQQGDHAYSLSLARSFLAHLYHLRQEPAAALTAATSGLELAERHGFGYWLVINTMFQGWATVCLHTTAATAPPASQVEAALAQMQDAFAGFKQSGAGLFRGYYRSLISEAEAATHAYASGLAGLAESIDQAAQTQDHFWLAELHRLRGELLLAQDAPAPERPRCEAEAEAAFLQAIQVAHQQAARMLELRAAISLARLWQRQGAGTRARALLQTQVAWFTEGWDTVDLQTAAALLAAWA